MSHLRLHCPAFVAAVLAAALAADAPALRAQTSGGAEDAQKGFYLVLQAPFFSGVMFPTQYAAYRADGPAAANDMYLGEVTRLSAKPTVGLGLGYKIRYRFIMFGVEAEWARASFADGREVLAEDTFTAATFTQRHFETDFTQAERTLDLLDVAFIFGVFPFRGLDLGFSFSAGGGYGRQSYRSPAVADAESRGYDVNGVREVDWFDAGDYDGGGAWSRGSFAYFVGLGSELFISRRLSVKLDYKYVASSYTRENVLISSGAVNVYQNKKGYEYTLGHRLSAGLAFHL